MTFEIDVAAQTRVVRIARGPAGYEVDVDGRRRDVDALRLGSGGWSLLIGGRSYAVGVVEQAAGALTVHVNGRAVSATVASPLRRRRAAAPAEAGSGPQTIVAPMPGRVVKVLVKAGDAVAARQGLVVVEAMKMENELRAPRAGVVREILVAEGTSVDANAVLVVVA